MSPNPTIRHFLFIANFATLFQNWVSWLLSCLGFCCLHQKKRNELWVKWIRDRLWTLPLQLTPRQRWHLWQNFFWVCHSEY
jgi:hypothetical protein